MRSPPKVVGIRLNTTIEIQWQEFRQNAVKLIRIWQILSMSSSFVKHGLKRMLKLRGKKVWLILPSPQAATGITSKVRLIVTFYKLLKEILITLLIQQLLGVSHSNSVGITLTAFVFYALSKKNNYPHSRDIDPPLNTTTNYLFNSRIIEKPFIFLFPIYDYITNLF
jgi:hypothetical protein